MLESIWRDTRYAIRGLMRNPGFSITVIVLLGLAMGANTAIFSMIEAVLLRPLPYHQPDRLCMLWKTAPARNIEWDWTSYPTIRDWRERNHVFKDLAFLLRPEGSEIAIAEDVGPRKIQASKVSENFFDLMGVAPLLGRTFSAKRPSSGNDVAVLSFAFWRRSYGADRSALGRALRYDGRSAIIIGVMPSNFQFPDKETQLWMPVASDSRWPAFQKFRVADAFSAIGRLKPGVSIQQARAEMTAIGGRLAGEYPETDAHLGIRIVPLAEQIAGPHVRRVLWIAAGVVFCVLLIACSNIASLLLARGASRTRELAIRAALGAKRKRLRRQFATENILLTLAGGLVGVLLAYGGLPALLALAPTDLPRSGDIAIDSMVLALNFGLCAAIGMMLALSTMPRTTGKDPATVLCAGGRGEPAGLGIGRTRGMLVACQFALATVLLSGAGLLIRSFQLILQVRPGFDTSHLLTVGIDLPSGRYEQESRIRAFFDQATERIEALPGVRGAAAGSGAFSISGGHAPNQSIIVDGRPQEVDAGQHERKLVGDSYFRVIGIPLRKGRLFSPDDVADGPPVAVINEAMARRYWPSEDALGKRFKEVLPGLDAPWLTVVGIAGDVSFHRDGSVAPVFYRSIRQWTLDRMSLVVRTKADPRSIAASVRRAIRSVDSDLPDVDVQTVEQQIRDLDGARRFQTGLLGLFAAVALTLAAVGLYGLMSYSVAQRTREIGIRVALGATSGNILRMVLRQGFWWTFAGIPVGCVCAAAFGQVLSSLLFGIRSTDPATFAIVILMLAAVAAVASCVPARRAARVDPTVSLRHE